MNKNELTEYADCLLQAAQKKCDNLADAQDLAQETLLAALNAINSGKEISDPKAWLMTVLNCKYYDMLRQKYRRPMVCIDVIGEIADDGEAEDLFEDFEEEEKIRRCLANLTKLYREVTVQYYMNGRSVAEIAKRMGIPENTVKNRLFTGKKHIRKEFVMEKYEKQSYAPEDLWISCSGRTGLNDEPFSVVGDDRIAMNLLILAYEKPVTLPELSGAIGISTTYIETIVKRLVENELMRQTADKVYTDFIIYTEEDRTANLSLQKQLAKELCPKLWAILDSGLEELRQCGYYRCQNAGQQVKLESFFVLRTVMQGVNRVRDEAVGGRMPFEDYPDRPDGGKWFAMANIYPHGYDYSACPYNLYGVSGECVTDSDDVLDAKWIALCDYDTEPAVLGKSTNSFSNKNQIIRLFYAVYLGRYDMVEMIDKRTLDQTEILIERDVLRRDSEGRLMLHIPVISMQDRWDFYRLSKKYDEILSERFHDAFMGLMQNPVKLPKHLKSVPDWLKSMYCCCYLPAMLILKARQQGLFLKGYDKPAPAVMLCVEKE